jgi:hypothetical protein
MRAGAPVYGAGDPQQWVEAYRKSGYGAACCPGRC